MTSLTGVIELLKLVTYGGRCVLDHSCSSMTAKPRLVLPAAGQVVQEFFKTIRV